jgi:hypothetical protein
MSKNDSSVPPERHSQLTLWSGKHSLPVMRVQASPPSKGLIDGDDGLRAEVVKPHAKEKHGCMKMWDERLSRSTLPRSRSTLRHGLPRRS